MTSTPNGVSYSSNTYTGTPGVFGGFCPSGTSGCFHSVLVIATVPRGKHLVLGFLIRRFPIKDTANTPNVFLRSGEGVPFLFREVVFPHQTIPASCRYGIPTIRSFTGIRNKANTGPVISSIGIFNYMADFSAIVFTVIIHRDCSEDSPDSQMPYRHTSPARQAYHLRYTSVF